MWGSKCLILSGLIRRTKVKVPSAWPGVALEQQRVGRRASRLGGVHASTLEQRRGRSHLTRQRPQTNYSREG